MEYFKGFKSNFKSLCAFGWWIFRIRLQTSIYLGRKLSNWPADLYEANLYNRRCTTIDHWVKNLIWIYDDLPQFLTNFSQRKCIFPDEVHLSYYNGDDYTFSGCMKECRIKRSLKFCSCVPPFYSPTGITLKHCGTNDFKCLIKYKTNITDIRACGQCELCCLNTVYDIEKFSKL